jgi:hypothetical protein
MNSIENAAAVLARAGLAFRGAFHPAADDAVPPLGPGRPAQTLVLAGTIGGSLWPTFSTSPEIADGAPDPLDRWTRRVLSRLADALGAIALFPFGGPPHLPFQRWAMRAEPVAPSPLGILIHPDHGLWHAYRGVLAFAERLDLKPPDRRPRPCDSCADRPCLSACPAGAFTGARYDVPRCLAHIAAPAGQDCMGRGCRARLACPIGRTLAYSSDQAHFHMAAFLGARQRGR